MRSIAEIFAGHGHFSNKEDSVEPRLRGLLSEALGKPQNLPIKSPRSTWDLLEDPGRLRREFDFSATDQLKFFLDNVVSYQEEVNHHGKILVIHNKVEIEVYTHDLEEVTNLDIQYAKEVDDIYKDALSVGRSRYVR